MAGVDHDTEAEKTSSAAEAEIVVSIDDLLLEIFRRVPLENDDRNNPLFKLASEHLNSQASYHYPLVQLRLVSRRWNSLISNNFLLPKPFPATRGLIFQCDPSRSKQTTSFSSTASNYILYLDKSKTTHEPFSKIDDTWHSRYKVVHSCNGLLLCASSRDYSVCNPTTGKHWALPQVPPSNNKVVIHAAFLAFDPCKSPHYKVVYVLGSEKEKDVRYFQFLVYSSETGSWEKCGKLLKTESVYFGNHTNWVYWNGAIHFHCAIGSSKLIRLNLYDDDRLFLPEVFPMPSIYFGESYGHLHSIGMEYGVRGGELVVHEMSSDYSGWVVKYRVDLSNVLGGRTKIQVYTMVRGERAEDTFLVLGTSSSWAWGGEKEEIVRFNLHDRTCETIYDFYGSENRLANPYKLRPLQYILSPLLLFSSSSPNRAF